MRGALIGCGFFAQNHLNAWRDMRADGVELVAVCDTDEAKARLAAATFGVPHFYTDAAKMLQTETLDFVDIATRMESHLSLVKLAAAAKVAAIVQKPLAPDWDEALAIVRTAKAAGIRLAIHENFRFQAPMLKARKLIEAGSIGKPSWGRFAFRTHFDVYRTQPYFHTEKRLAILDVGIHILDLARLFLGEVERISCETQRRNSKNVGEDTATMLLRHVSGAVSLVECSYEVARRSRPVSRNPDIAGRRRGLACSRRRPHGPPVSRRRRRDARSRLRPAELDRASLARRAGKRVGDAAGDHSRLGRRTRSRDARRGQFEDVCACRSGL